jgi:membrane protein DedA with SNARE-associated domain
MALPTHILLTYGYFLLFAWVLAEQFGIPVPATPVLLAAGALSVDGPFSFFLALALSVVATLIADVTWFFIGRRLGHNVLRLLCKLSLEPTTCVRRTQDSFARRRGVMLMFAKFVPGLGILAPPVAGENGMGFGSFLFFDGIGATLWAGTLLAAGRFFGDLLKRNPNLLSWVGRFSGALLLLGIIVFFMIRLYRRRVDDRSAASGVRFRGRIYFRYPTLSASKSRIKWGDGLKSRALTNRRRGPFDSAQGRLCRYSRPGGWRYAFEHEL